MKMKKCWKFVAMGLLLLSVEIAMAENSNVELADYMGTLQKFLHKTNLALNANNRKLAGFYAHELEEAIDELKQLEDYEGIKVASLVNKILVPAFSDFENHLEKGKLQKAKNSFSQLINACNSCHKEAGYEIIVIRKNDSNPFMQDFSPN